MANPDKNKTVTSGPVRQTFSKKVDATETNVQDIEKRSLYNSTDMQIKFKKQIQSATQRIKTALVLIQGLYFVFK